MSDHGLCMQDLWSAQAPTINTWPYTNDNLLPPSAVPSYREPIVHSQQLTYSVHSKELCRAAAKFMQRRSTHLKVPGFYTRRNGKLIQMCPYQSYIFSYFNFMTGLLDTHDATAIASLQNAKINIYKINDLPNAVFRNRRNLEFYHNHVTILPQNYPFWIAHPERIRRAKRHLEEDYKKEEGEIDTSQRKKKQRR